MGVLVLLVAVLAGCDSDPPSPERSVAWPTTSTPLRPSGLVWAQRSEVHLGDSGDTIDVGGDIASFVVAGDGVFYTLESDEAGPASEGGDLIERPLYFTDGSGAPRELAASAATLRVSTDGRYLAYLDLTSGERDGFGTPQIEVVARDLQTGEEVLRSTEGMLDPDEDDLAAVYPEAPPAVLRVDERAAYVDTSDGRILALSLSTGEARSVKPSEVGLPAPGASPSGRWTIVQTDHDGSRIASRRGSTVPLRGAGGRVVLRFWVDDSTAAGYLDRKPYPLVTCTPSGRCAPVPGSGGDHVVYPSGVAP